MLILDEPTTGLDPRSLSTCGSRSRISWPGGATILLTPVLEEVDRLAHWIGGAGLIAFLVSDAAALG